MFEALARAANVNFVFDKDVRGEAKVTLFLRQTSVDEALRVILNTQQLGQAAQCQHGAGSQHPAKAA